MGAWIHFPFLTVIFCTYEGVKKEKFPKIVGAEAPIAPILLVTLMFDSQLTQKKLNLTLHSHKSFVVPSR